MIRKLITKTVTLCRLPYNKYDGEMLPLERLRLYQWMTTYRPKTVLEVGTGVGGSTFYMSEALRRYGGTLHTCDPARRPPQDFLDRFRGTLAFHACTSERLIEELAAQAIVPDMLFFDGPEIPALALQDIRRLEPRLAQGCLFAMHDWSQAGPCNPRIVSVKAEQIRPYMEQSPRWQQIDRLRGHQKNVWWTKGRFDSVGLCLFRFTGNCSTLSRAA